MSGVSGQRLDRNGLPGGFGGGAENRTPASWLQAKCAATITTPIELVQAVGIEPTNACVSDTCSPGELRRVEPPARVELASPRYKPGASPSMLTGLGASSERVELASLVWKTRAPAAIPYPLSRGGGTCTRLKWLMRPCWNYLQSTPQNGHSIVKDLVGAAGFEPANLLRPRQAAFHLPTPQRLDTSELRRESFPAKAIELHRSAKCVQKQKGRIFWTRPS